jgi:hypothetical protein
MQEKELFSSEKWTSLCTSLQPAERKAVQLRMAAASDLWIVKSENNRTISQSGLPTLRLSRIAATSSCTTLGVPPTVKDLFQTEVYLLEAEVGVRHLVLCLVRLSTQRKDRRRRLRCPGNMIFTKSSTRKHKLQHRTNWRNSNSTERTRHVFLRRALFCRYMLRDKHRQPLFRSIVPSRWPKVRLASYFQA